MPKKEVKKEDRKLAHHEMIAAELDADTKDGYHYGYASGDDVIKFPEKITTGSIVFDKILEGGYRCGWSRFSGDPQMGKTSQGLVWGGHWQRKFPDDGFVVVFNAEGRVTSDLVRRSGLDPDSKRFIRIDSNVGDYVVEKMEKWIRFNPSGIRYFFVLDSSDALLRIHDMDKTAKDSEKIGGGATLLSYTGKRLSLPIAVKGHHLYITSQLRDKMSAMSSGKGESGGNAPKFYSSLSGRFRRYYVKGSEDGNIYNEKDEIIGKKTLVELYKSPNEAKSDVLLHVQNGRSGGIWTEYEIFYLMQAYGMIEKSGSWLSPTESFAAELVKDKILDEPFAIQGELKVVRFFETQPKLVEYVKNLILCQN